MTTTRNSRFPNRWRFVQLGDEFPLSYGKALAANVRDADGTVPVLGSAGVVGRHSKALVDGPVVVVGRKGNVGAAHIVFEPCWPIDTTYFAKPRCDQDPKFFKYLLDYLDLRSLDSSTAVPSLSRDDYNAVRVGVPNLSEQHHIVAAIETLFSRLDAAVASLTRARTNVKRARASVLKAAVEGRLVPTEAELARAEGRDYEPASELLERILVERRAAHEAAQEGAKRRKKYKEPVAPETDGLPELPEGWCWATLEQLGDGARPFAYGVLVPGPDVEDGVPFVRVGDIGDGWVADRPEKSIARAVADKFKRTYLDGGEVLMSIVGTIGRVGIAPPRLKGANVARAVAVLPLATSLSAPCIVSALRSPSVQQRLVGAAHEVARKTLNMEDVRAAVIPLPPLAEQHRIVAEVDRRLSVLDALDATIEANLARCARLRQSILKRAFEGRLVPADAPPSETLPATESSKPQPAVETCS